METFEGLKCLLRQFLIRDTSLEIIFNMLSCSDKKGGVLFGWLSVSPYLRAPLFECIFDKNSAYDYR